MPFQIQMKKEEDANWCIRCENLFLSMMLTKKKLWKDKNPKKHLSIVFT